jgi:hypothetical protein
MIEQIETKEIEQLKKADDSIPEVENPIEKKEAPELAERIYLKTGSFEVELSSLKFNIFDLSNLLLQLKERIEIKHDADIRDYVG